MKRRSIVAASVGAFALLGAVWGYVALTYEPGADRSFDTRVDAPALTARVPRVLFDAGHGNSHSIGGRYGPFRALIESDGCRVAPISAAFSARSLRGADVLVIVNARGPKDRRSEPAFTPAECDAVREWVRGGGSLLLVADHHPYGAAAADLAARFGVRMIGGWVDDERCARPASGDPGQLLFTRESGRLADHAITRAVAGAAINTVETFTGQSLEAPPEASPLLLLSETAVDRIPVSSERSTQGSTTVTTFQTDDRPATGHCQGLAMRFGKGRVVVLGEAAMLTAQIDDKSGRKFGMNAPGNDDRAFALNVVRWLAGALGDQAGARVNRLKASAAGTRA